MSEGQNPFEIEVGNVPPTRFQTRYDLLVEKAMEMVPGTRILAEQFPESMRGDPHYTKKRTEAIGALVARRIRPHHEHLIKVKHRDGRIWLDCLPKGRW